MAKQKKKRSKVYTGVDSRQTRPQVVRISAENRSAPKQWWVDHQRVARPLLIVAGIIFLLVLLVTGIIGIVSM